MNFEFDILDASGYPTEETLTEIQYWPVKTSEDWIQLMGFIKSIWRYADFGYWEEDENYFKIATGGWSGNEDIIRALSLNTWWDIKWELSRKGGAYEFSK